MTKEQKNYGILREGYERRGITNGVASPGNKSSQPEKPKPNFVPPAKPNKK